MSDPIDLFQAGMLVWIAALLLAEGRAKRGGRPQAGAPGPNDLDVLIEAAQRRSKGPEALVLPGAGELPPMGRRTPRPRR